MRQDEVKTMEANQRKGAIMSVIIHILFIALLLFPLFSYQDPPPELEGILVSFGEVDTGQGDDRPTTQNEEYVEQSAPAAQKEVESEVVPDKVEDKIVKEVAKEEKKLTTEDPQAIALRKQKEKEAQEAAKKRAEAEAARKKAAEEEARKQAEAEAAKKQFGDIFGKGKGNTGKDGNQGTPDGDPDSKILQGISTGSGVVGGGLGTRGVRSEPKITDRSQKSGKVVVNVCVDSAGKVISAEYTQRGSTTTDRELRDIAVKNAKLFQFTESNIDKQCGTITINFQLE